MVWERQETYMHWYSEAMCVSGRLEGQSNNPLYHWIGPPVASSAPAAKESTASLKVTNKSGKSSLEQLSKENLSLGQEETADELAKSGVSAPGSELVGIPENLMNGN